MKRLLQKARARLGRFRASSSGATAVEFALVAGPFFYVLGCICETGLMLFTEYVLQNSVQDAARLVRTGQLMSADGTTVSVSASDFKIKVCQDVSVIIDCAGKVSVYVNSADTFAALTAAIPNPINVGVASNGAPYKVVYTPGIKLKAATVIATYDWDFAFPFMDFLGNIGNGSKRRLYGLAIFRNEPFP